ncbi:MAG TPA: DNA polymerase III subunit delta [Xanthobacteraceae bacterium]|nr:DNA polymerase III subunit delta [Xanthobacteraceae bacterium]
MVALRVGEIESFLARPDPRRRVVLIYGPDAGLVSERAAAILSGAASGDPFAVVPIEGDAIASDPGLLHDEVRTFGLFGGRRIVRIRAGGRNFAPALEAVLADPPEALVLIEAGELRPTSPLRALCEKSPAAAVIPCYADGERDLRNLIERALKDARLSIDADARDELMALLGADRLASRAELDKLVLYAEGEGRIGVEDVRAIIADASALALDDLVDAAGAGEEETALTALRKARAAGVSASAILSAAIRHVAQLHRLRLSVEHGARPGEAIDNAKPRIFFRRKPAFERALARFDTGHLEAAIISLSLASLEARRTAVLADATAERALLNLARGARRRDSVASA